jgi:hypothetical protein
MEVANTLAYYNMVTISAIKYLIAHACIVKRTYFLVS